jgi:tRNA modification GTPase
MRAPRSYTGEDAAELHAHGGARVLQRILDAVLAAGARMAEPGEFTRRAFEAGKLDLTRAEAVAELIAARTDRALSAARALLSGELEREVRAIRQELIRALAELEGAIDFPDEQLDAQPEAESARVLAALQARFEKLAGTYRRFVAERAEILLVGRVNAGKSSLLNALAGEERALVDASAGTTRDLVEAECDLGGVLARVVDTAGERDEATALEKRGIELWRKRRGRADAIVLVVDGTVGFGASERALWDELAGTPRVIAWNKRDLGGAASGLPDGASVVETVAPGGEGVDALRCALVAALGEGGDEGGLRVSARHREALLDGAAALARAADELGRQQPPELAAVEARQALHHLGRITGETVDAEVLDAIFARFCIGK